MRAGKEGDDPQHVCSSINVRECIVEYVVDFVARKRMFLRLSRISYRIVADLLRDAQRVHGIKFAADRCRS